MKKIFAVLSPIVATSFLVQAMLAQAPATACGTDSRNYTFKTDSDISIRAVGLIVGGKGRWRSIDGCLSLSLKNESWGSEFRFRSTEQPESAEKMQRRKGRLL